jgi:hypothetical protein
MIKAIPSRPRRYRISAKRVYVRIVQRLWLTLAEPEACVKTARYSPNPGRSQCERRHRRRRTRHSHLTWHGCPPWSGWRPVAVQPSRQQTSVSCPGLTVPPAVTTAVFHTMTLLSAQPAAARGFPTPSSAICEKAGVLRAITAASAIQSVRSLRIDAFHSLKIEIENAIRRQLLWNRARQPAQNLSRSGYSASLSPAAPWSDTETPLPRPIHLFAPAVSSSVAAGVLF